jgi:hypothetical protein
MANRKPIVLAITGMLERIPDTDSIIVLSAAFIGNAILIPAANGAFQLGIGGNAKGVGSVDLQTVRTADTQVASGAGAQILGGERNTANGPGASIVGGVDGIASGNRAVICGGQTNTASGSGSIICGGVSNISSGSRSVICGGDGNTASNDYDIVVGGQNQAANGRLNFIGGGYTNIISYTALAGYNVISGGRENSIDSHCSVISGGYKNTIPVNTGDYNTIIGGYSNTFVAAATNNGGNTLGGFDSSIQGHYCIIPGGYSNNIVLADGARFSTISGGRENAINENYSVIGGGYLNSIAATSGNYNTIGGGQENTIIAGTGGHNTITGGYRNSTLLASTYNGRNVIHGYYNTLQGQCCVVCGGYTNDIYKDAGALYSTIVGGTANGCHDDYCFVGGGQLNVSRVPYATVVGGYSNQIDYGSGNYCFIGGGYTNRIDTASTNNGTSFIGGGNINLINGQYCCIVGGNNNNIIADPGAIAATIGGGDSNVITGDYASIPGGKENNVDSDYSLAAGFNAKTTLYGQVAQASGKLAVNGDAQTSILVARNQTTDANAVELFLDSSAQRLTIPVSTSWFFTVKVIARQTNDDFSVNIYHIEGSFSRDAGNAAVDYQVTLASNEEDANWNFTVSADTGNQSLKLEATGAAANNISWVARVELVQVTG